MRVVERAFDTAAEARAFIEGVEFVNDAELEVRHLVLEMNVGAKLGTLPPIRFVVIMVDSDGEENIDELVEDAGWQRIYPDYTNELTYNTAEGQSGHGSPASLRYRIGQRR